MEFKNDNQLKSFLKSESNRLGISIENTYNTYFSRLLLERLSKINYKNIYVKGSFSELVHLDSMTRPITDLDLVSTGLHNDPLLVLYKTMYDSNEEIQYELSDIPKRTPTGIYKLKITANFGRIKHPLSIDFQELSNTIYEKDYKRVNSIFKGDNQFYIYTPSYEEHLAEKLCIVIESNKQNVLNTRVKDFYDIYKLYGGKYDDEKLLYFFYNMLKDRNKISIDSVSTKFINDEYINKHKSLWNSMSEKYEFLDKSVKFDEAVYLTKDILDNKVNNLEKAKKLKIRLR